MRRLTDTPLPPSPCLVPCCDILLCCQRLHGDGRLFQHITVQTNLPESFQQRHLGMVQHGFQYHTGGQGMNYSCPLSGQQVIFQRCLWDHLDAIHPALDFDLEMSQTGRPASLNQKERRTNKFISWIFNYQPREQRPWTLFLQKQALPPRSSMRQVTKVSVSVSDVKRDQNIGSDRTMCVSGRERTICLRQRMYRMTFNTPATGGTPLFLLYTLV